jgi:hypothetical protein
MTITEYANIARAFMAAEIAMASVNCGVANVTRTQGEKLLGNYFALAERAIPWTEISSPGPPVLIRAPQRGNQEF